MQKPNLRQGYDRQVCTQPGVRSCANSEGGCSASFEITDDERAFLKKIRYTFGGTNMYPAEPRMCPICRMRLRTCHRNEKNLYRNVSAKSGKSLVSICAPESLLEEPIQIYTQEEWHDDSFDAIAYGKDFDVAKSFFEQFSALSAKVPRMAVVTIGNENSVYTTGTGYCRNCYLINSSEHCEDCLYGKLFQKCHDIVDSAYMYSCELCYDCFSLHDCTRCTSVFFSKNTHNCYFSSNLQGCDNCFLCTNLTQKEYHIRNKPVSREIFEKEVQAILGSHEEFKKAKQQLHSSMEMKVWKYSNIVNCENCTGDFIEDSRNCIECFDMTNCEDCRYVQVGVSIKDSYDCSNMYLKSELCYEILGSIEAHTCCYCLYVFHSQNLLYCENCFSCSNCFGCSGLMRKEFCIFNKQYTKEEYGQCVPKIIEHMQRNGEWGMFFPSRYSIFGYNESVANEYLPLSKKKATSGGFLWRESTLEKPDVLKVIDADRLPDSIDEIPDDVVNWAISCKETGRPFRILKHELAFYRKQHIPIPRLHPDIRYERRMELHNHRKLWDRECAKCSKEIQTTYSPDRKEIVYCEECYLKEVY